MVNVVISNKAAARDPEGETIHRELVGSDYSQVRSVRVGKLLMVRVEAADSAEAEKLVRRMCDDLRIYNPAAHRCDVSAGRLPE